MCEIAEEVNPTRGVFSPSTAAPETQHERFVENMTHPFLGSHGLLFSNDGGLYFCNISDNLLKDCKTFLFLGLQLALGKEFNPAGLTSKQVKKHTSSEKQAEIAEKQTENKHGFSRLLLLIHKRGPQNGNSRNTDVSQSVCPQRHLYRERINTERN